MRAGQHVLACFNESVSCVRMWCVASLQSTVCTTTTNSSGIVTLKSFQTKTKFTRARTNVDKFANTHFHRTAQVNRQSLSIQTTIKPGMPDVPACLCMCLFGQHTCPLSHTFAPYHGVLPGTTMHHVYSGAVCHIDCISMLCRVDMVVHRAARHV